MKDKLVAEYYSWARSLLIKRYGLEAEAFTGIALMHALEQHGHAEDFRAEARNTILSVASTEFKSENGRAKSRKRCAQSVSLESVPEPMYLQQASGYDDEDSLATLDKLPGIERLIALCRYLGNFDDCDIAQILERRSIRLV